jgi:hypothetical protein
MWQELLTNPWWTYDPATVSGWGRAYRWFNIGEAAVWLVFAVLVVNRWRRRRHSPVELLYGVAFATFGLTDIREASVISATVVLVKGANLAALLWLRAQVMRRWYPENRLY